jgi:MFS family permease
MTKLGRSFNLLWTASTISNVGDGIMGAAFPLLVASVTRDPVLVSGASVVGRLPWFLFALVSGALVDRMDRRRVMIWTDVFRAVVVGALALLVASDQAGLAVIYGVAFLLGSAETMFDTSAEAIIPKLVTSQDLTAANGRLQATEWVAGTFAGPPVGAALFALAAATPFLVDSVSFLVAAVVIALIAGQFTSDRAAGPSSIRKDIAEGVRWLWRNRVLRTLSLMAGGINLFSTGIIAIFVLFAQDILDVTDVGYGVLLTVIGLGGLVGAMASRFTVARFGPGVTAHGVVVLGAVLSAIIGALSNVYLVGFLLVFYGFVVVHWNVVSITLRQQLVPDDLRGRVASVARLIAWGTQPLGALLGGLLAAGLGLRAPFYVAAIAWIAMTLVTVPIVNNRSIAALQEEHNRAG